MSTEGVSRKVKNIVHSIYLDHLSDEAYCKVKFKRALGSELDISNPQTYNEKVQWLKMNYRLPVFTRMVDKYEAKDYIKHLVGEDVIIPTIAVWESAEEIDPSILPDRFVMKCTHDSHTVFVCKDKEKFDFEAAKKQIGKALKKNFYYVGREWPYKNVKPRVIVEEYLEDNNSPSLLDYKFYMFYGTYKMLSITERASQHEVFIDYYDESGTQIDMTWGYPSSGKNRSFPKSFPQMLQLAKKLSRDLPFLRVDMYEVNCHPFVGELTLYDGAGFDRIEPAKWDKQLGDWIDLEKLIRGGTD